MEEIDEIRQRKMNDLLERAQEIDKRKNYPSAPVTITDANFHETINKYPLVVIDFWASWCAPCKRLVPIINDLSGEYARRVVFGKLNTDENRATSIHYNVMSIPTLVIFKDGSVIDRIVGAVPKQAITERLNKFLL